MSPDRLSASCWRPWLRLMPAHLWLASIAAFIFAAPAALAAEESASAIERKIVTITYDVADLIATDPARPAPSPAISRKRAKASLVTLAKLLSQLVAPTAWSNAGGPGQIGMPKTGEPQLIISQTAEIQAEIAELLQALRSDALESPAPDRRQKKVLAALEQRLSIDFHDKPLPEALKSLADALPPALKVPIDQPVLPNPWAPQTSVTLTAANIRLRSALELILQQHDLGWYSPRTEVIEIVERHSEYGWWGDHWRVYDVSDLVLSASRRPDTFTRLDHLCQTIMDVVCPSSWSPVGGAGDITPYRVKGRVKLIVCQEASIQEEIRNLFSELRAVPFVPDAASPAGDGVMSRAARVRYETALHAPVSVDIDQQPLSAALEKLVNEVPAAQRVSVLPSPSLEWRADYRNQPVTLRAFRGTFETALDKCLRPLDLGVFQSRDVLMIDDREQAERQSDETRVYDVTQVTAAEHKIAEQAKLDDLLALVRSLAPAESWSDQGDFGEAAALNLNRRWLIVHHTLAVHAAIEARLAGLPTKR